MLPPCVHTVFLSTAISSVSSLYVINSSEWTDCIRSGYTDDKWTLRVLGSLWDSTAKDPLNRLTTLRPCTGRGRNDVKKVSFRVLNQLLFIAAIPPIHALREDLIGHLGVEKSYLLLRFAHYWPKLREELETFC